ncbi:MAG: proton-conducting transporter membrane subunit [Candidatus Omnitrophica bacterium]|nr:proton-conducting transporter membrane subunit [Candidatus Omnitrophota bacterium]MDD5352505.1 proton-conducting transporter membrane subunit [Candidatus Omnitrophota bacterium]MDD5550103.1 proton-conducting transporter membrane subunit [Candidatus Omnitrophota bacterium]
MRNLLLSSLIVPFILGLVSFILPKKNKTLACALAIIASFATFIVCIAVFMLKSKFYLDNSYIYTLQYFLVDNLSAFIALFIGLFGFLIVLYSSGFMKDKEELNKYYAYVLWTISASIGAVISNNFLLFLTFWGVLGITLYLLIAMGTEDAPASAKKAFIIIGGSDALILLGMAAVFQLSPFLEISRIHIPLTNNLAVFSFICLALGAFAKSGAMPLHTWIPDSAETAPTPVMAFLPASLDKLLGIYLLFRISVNIFDIQPNSAISLFLMIIGSITIIAAVMMALVQHNFKKLLSYHAVSQVGYMILGIGTANPIGIAGGLFHMLNNAVYKSCLFLSGGNVEYRAKTDDLSKLGGLAKFMPVTFIAFAIASFSISGIPPFNGFVSKWMIYQGIIELGKTGTKLWPLWLSVAMFGSALTLASFMKLIHAIFLGQPSAKKIDDAKEVPAVMNIAPVILAGLCIIFGVWATQIPLRLFIVPSMQTHLTFSGMWNSSLATILILVGLLIGFIIYLLGSLKSREVRQFIGGEDLEKNPQMNPSGAEFYNTVREIPLLQFLYKRAEEKLFDIYEMGKRAVFGVSSLFSYLHNGILPTYCVWILLGMIVIMLVIL